jgi:hypothetical protein
MLAAVRNIPRSIRDCLAGGLLLLACGTVLAADPQPWHEVHDPHFGEVLYDFYQQKYFTALGDLMAAQQLGQVPHDADEAELLRGGLYLSYGLHVEAGRIFERLIAAGAPPAVRDRAWFYLAKIRYQRGYQDQAEQALARIGGRLPGDLEDQRQILHAILLMDQGRYREAAEHLTGLKGKSDWIRYGRFNLGVALVRAGETERGIALLDQLGKEPAASEELKSLRDKANVAIGYIYLQAGQPERARDALDRVRLDGLASNKALLGMGWAYSALGKQDKALVFWNELKQRDQLDTAVQESLLAAPYALGKLGALRQSLQDYERAIAVYTREMGRIDTAIEGIRAGQLGASLLGHDTGEEMGWFWKLDTLPDRPEFEYLATLLASHDFQEALKNYRDLRFLQARLNRWSSDVASFQDMLATRRAAFRQRLPEVMKSARMRNQPAIVAERDRLAAELGRIEHDNDGEALATDKEKAQLDRLESIRSRLSRHASSDEDWERYRVLRGLLRWDIETDFSSRLWQAKQSLRDLDAALAENDTRREQIAQASEKAPREFDAFESRITALKPRIARLQGLAAELARAQEAQLNDLAIAELRVRRERLASYLTQARFAVAQIYDHAASQSPEAQ